MTTTPGDDFSHYVAEQIRGEAATRGLSISALARHMGTDRVTLHRYLSGARALPVPILYNAANTIGVSVRLIVDRAEDRMVTDYAHSAESPVVDE